MKTRLNLSGKRFGRLVATNYMSGINGHKKRLCHCDCGENIWVRTAKLINGHTKTCGCSRQLKIGQAARNSVLYDYKYNAKIRKLSWRLTDKQFDKLTSGLCFFCGRPPSKTVIYGRGNGKFTYNGIDRLDNKIGYTTHNSVSCCSTCNMAKNKLPLKDFLSWIKAIKKHKIKLKNISP